MSKKSLSGIIALLLVVVIGMALNPSLEKHRAAISAAVAERSPIAGALGLGGLVALVPDYHSLGLLSYTTVDERTISVGAFSGVWVLKGKD